MNLVEWFIANPIKVAVGVLLVALFGVISLLRMPMQLTPEVQTPTLQIETRWPGASPQEVEREIVLEQEEQLKGVEGVIEMTSESKDSLGEINLEFAVGTNMNEALLTVNGRLAQVPEYPEDAERPVISTRNVSDRPIAYFTLGPREPSDDELRAAQRQYPELSEQLDHVLRAHSPALTVHRLQQLADAHPELRPLLPKEVEVNKLLRFVEDNVESRLERVEGISAVEIYGGQEEELRVVVDPEKLAARQLTIYDVRNALRDENKDTSGGDLWEGKRRYVVRTLGQFDSPEEVEGVLLAVRQGAPVFVRDVARVELGFKKPESIVRRFGRLGINLSASRETGANVLEVMEGLRAATRELNEGVLGDLDIQLVQVYDETDYIHASIGLVQGNIVVGGLLTVAVLLLFLRSGRSTLIIALAIPISIIGTFLFLDILGRSLNVVSLAGLAFAVGMLVDNAIVVLENIYAHYQRGASPLRASIDGPLEVWGAVVASTMTTLAVFVPVLFVEEEAGQLFRDIALAISAAVGLSIVVSIIIIPVGASQILRKRRGAGDPLPLTNGHAAHVLGDDDEQPWQPAQPTRSTSIHGRLLDALAYCGQAFVDAVVGANRWLQGSLLRELAMVALLVGASLVLSWLMLPKVEYLPTGNRNIVFGNLVPPPGYNIDQLVEMGGRLEEQLMPYWDMDPDSPEAMRPGAPPVVSDFYFMARERRVMLIIRAVDPDRASELVPMVRRATAELPGTFSSAKQSSLFERGTTGGRAIDVVIRGPDLEKLVALGERVMTMADAAVPGSQLLPIPSLDLSSPEVQLKPRRRQGKQLMMSASELGYTVDALVDGAYATDYYLDGDKIDLSIVGREDRAQRTQDLGSLPVATSAGKLVTLASLADIEPYGAGPEQVNRRERQRAITIQVSPPLQVPMQEAQERIEAAVIDVLRGEGALEGGYQISLEGTTDKLRETWQALRFNVLLALLITYLLMAALFESWLYPLVIILTVPLGAVGGIGGLWLLNLFVLQPLDVLTMLGFVMLIGTVVNNPILIVHQSINHVRDDGMTPGDAILESVRTRVRPIFMTTATTVFGLLPLVVFPGSGSELYRGIGVVLLGGLGVSTIFTLILVPSLFKLTMAGRKWLLGRNHRDEHPAEQRPGEPHRPLAAPRPIKKSRVRST